MRVPQKLEKRIVSKRKYLAVKTLALGLSGISVLGGIGLVILLSNFVFAYYNDAQFQALCHSRGCSVYQMDDSALNAFGAAVSLILLIPLLPMMYGAWRGSCKNWEAIRIMQPLTRAISNDLPASDSLVRASQEPLQAQQSVLLRAAAETSDNQELQLLRATAQ